MLKVNWIDRNFTKTIPAFTTMSLAFDQRPILDPFQPVGLELIYVICN
jgi:hypothetical protein